MTRFDFTPYRRSTVGFDRLFDLLENSARAPQGDNYPPFNLERVADDHHRITIAVAGFRSDEIEITGQPNQLVVTGSKDTGDSEAREYLHMGIAARNFERRFQLADYIRVDGANLADGLLVIDLRREIPEAMKPRKIAVDSGRATTIEPKQAKRTDGGDAGTTGSDQQAA